MGRDLDHEALPLLRATGLGLLGCSPLARVPARPGVTSVSVGARRPDQLEQNLAAVDLALTPQDIADLDEVSEPPRMYPQWALDAAYPVRTPLSG
ncbi:aldo/keto reductase [Streptomyces sp. NPDC047002]|uniref:aldo/keto reductase n=1 Tax=Streptomyces sp. NPDC047002 TaxID=3155475 RepID=UPI003453A4CB